MNILKLKLMNLMLTVRPKISETCVGASVTFKKGYQPRTHIFKDEKDDLVTDSVSILASWRNHFSQLLNVHGVNDIKHTDTHSRTTSA